mmetsp:Transcript_100486/g.299817  ORF Transcript_100486/g.299817 Transcript_100486/m.299817 type:complete len:432 (+) Transcript_100486:63-1358(+)
MADTSPAKRIAIIGAGPIGLEMALGSVMRGLEVSLFEKAESCAGHVQSYHFVRLFSPWKLNYTPAGLEALGKLGVAGPTDEESFPTGQEFYDEYLKPLTKALEQHPKCRGMHFGTEVLSIGRGALLKGESIGGGAMCMPSHAPLCQTQRAQTPFRLLVRDAAGERFLDGFDFIADCTGSYRGDFANWSGIGGMPAPGERALRTSGRIWSTIPDVLGAARARFAGKTALVVGSGMSAATALRNLAELAKEDQGTQVHWATRSNGSPFKVIEDDVLPQRKELCLMGNSAARGDIPSIKYQGGACVKAIEQSQGGRLHVVLETLEGECAVEVDEFVGCCGFRPDTALYSELQVHTCYASDGPIKLAATLLGGSGDCLKQVSAGADALKSPEPGFFILGHKSYGRSSAFLLKIGHEQVRTVLDEIAPAADAAAGN